VIGPHVSIGADSVVVDSRIENGLVQTGTSIAHANLWGAMIGNKAQVEGRPMDASLGDFCTLQC
jgi:glucose-1-phosphate thymidylyltransferase